MTYGLPAVPLVGLLTYGILRQLYADFYGALGASPEEVGVGYSQVLSLSGIGLLVVVAPAMLVLVIGLIFPDRHWPKVIRAAGVVASVAAILLIGSLGYLWCRRETLDSRRMRATRSAR